MIPEERESIKEMYVDFLDNVHIDPEFLGPLIQDGVLTETMVAMIQAKSSQYEKILELLQVLPRCGQNAFQCFLKALRTRSRWLAEKLQQKYNEKLDGSQHTSHALDNPIIEYDHVSHSEDEEGQNEKEESQESTPVHSANLSEKHIDVRSFSPRIFQRSAGAVEVRYQHKLNHLYVSLKNKLRKHEKRELSFAPPEPATFQMIEKLHDELFEKLTVLQMNMDQCSKAFGSNTKVPLISQIIDLKTRQTDLEKRLKVSEKRRNKYCEQITKLDLNVRNLASELQINEEKLKNKEKKVTEYKHQIQILEDELKLTEKKSTELEDVTHVRQMKNEKVQKENEQLIREKHVYQPNSTNSTGTKENLNGTLKLSNQSKVNRTDKNEENESTSTRQSQNPIVKIDGPQTEKGRLNQGSRRIQRRYNDYYSLSYIGGSIQNSKPDVNITNEEEELSNNNSLKAPTPRLQPEGRSKLQVPTVAKHRLFHYESTEHQPRKATTTQMLNKQFHQQILMTVMPERNAKKQAERTSPSRKGNKSKSLLRTLATNRLKMEKIQK